MLQHPTPVITILPLAKIFTCKGSHILRAIAGNDSNSQYPIYLFTYKIVNVKIISINLYSFYLILLPLYLFDMSIVVEVTTT